MTKGEKNGKIVAEALLLILEKRFIFGLALAGYTLIGLSFFHAAIGTTPATRAVVAGFVTILAAVVLFGVRAFVIHYRKHRLKQQLNALYDENDRLYDEMSNLRLIWIGPGSYEKHRALRDSSDAHLPSKFAIFTETQIPSYGDDMRGIACLRIKIATEEERKRCHTATRDRILADLQAWGDERCTFVETVSSMLASGVLRNNPASDAWFCRQLVEQAAAQLPTLRNRWVSSLTTDSKAADKIAEEILALTQRAEFSSRYAAQMLPEQ